MLEYNFVRLFALFRILLAHRCDSSKHIDLFLDVRPLTAETIFEGGGLIYYYGVFSV